ncbi:MAG: hypothetical protein J7K00_03980 [Candidatus Diapherotrites archaeon]|nr:hypothetical protein [Candidatus Diapherotrites archaeon]
MVEAFFKFAGDQKLRVVKTDDGVIEEIFELPEDDIKENMLLLGEGKGLFFDDDICISYGVLSNGFFAYVDLVLMFSGTEKDVECMVEMLDGYSIEHFEPFGLKEGS